MQSFWYWIFLIAGWGIFVVWGHAALRLFLFYYSSSRLPEQSEPATREQRKPVRVIVPACNESDTLEACLISLIKQDYENLEIVAINDRSTDGTGEIMDSVASSSGRVRVIQVDSLPEKWLGKNHANWLGAAMDEGEDTEYFLFTDGDVIFEPDCISRAVAYLEKYKLDHLCLLPQAIPGGFWENAMCHFFIICYLLKCKPWHLGNFNRPDSFIGVGAFNLVSRNAYCSIGGHRKLRMEVADDYKLGKLLKQSGYHCGALFSHGSIKVRWQVGLRGVIRGLEKNVLAAFDYSLIRMLTDTMLFFSGAVLPVMMTLLVVGWAGSGWFASVILQIVLLAWFAVVGRCSVLVGLTFPICAIGFLGTVLRSVMLAHYRGGIWWRGTFYQMDALRRGSV